MIYTNKFLLLSVLTGSTTSGRIQTSSRRNRVWQQTSFRSNTDRNTKDEGNKLELQCILFKRNDTGNLKPKATGDTYLYFNKNKFGIIRLSIKLEFCITDGGILLRHCIFGLR